MLTPLQKSLLVPAVLVTWFCVSAAEAHRQYDPGLRRFAQRDPMIVASRGAFRVIDALSGAIVETNGGLPIANPRYQIIEVGPYSDYRSGMNTFQYVLARPHVATDPFGLADYYPDIPVCADVVCGWPDAAPGGQGTDCQWRRTPHPDNFYWGCSGQCYPFNCGCLKCQRDTKSPQGWVLLCDCYKHEYVCGPWG
jgi:hypothetical protein